MLIKPNQLIQPKTSSQLSIKIITNNEEFTQWSSVIAKSFDFSQSVSEQYENLFNKVGINGPLFHLIGEKNHQTICTGTLLLTKTGGYIYNIATIENERQSGYASELIYKLVQMAKSHQCQQIALISSPQATSMCSKLGFQQITSYHIYA